LPAAGTTDAELALSVPVETNLGLPNVPSAQDTWVQMIDSAQKTLEFGEFYASNQAGEALEPVLQAVERAGARGVQIRWVFEKGMLSNDPVVYQRIQAIKNSQMRAYDISKLTGGIIHAKYFVVDGKELFIGSQNFDWRALDQIHETGVHVKDAALSAQLQSVFEIDWQIAATGQAPPVPPTATGAPTAEVELVASPPQFNPPGMRGTITALVELMGQAKKSLKIQVMSYSAGKNRSWPELDDAIRAAAARGVAVELLVSDWSFGADSVTQFKSLLQVPGVEVRYSTIPQASTGCIPYSRLVHSKFVVVDDDKLFVSTSNWEKGYFYATRDVDLIFRGRPDLNSQGAAIFDQLWASQYVHAIEATGTYATGDHTCGTGH
jgi:phosphatidylserine/phosphatidylglycerophosphate/cardiolipin synthase-like enzyme